MTQPESITCPECGMTSHHPEDVKQQYCGNCHMFHDDMKQLRELGYAPDHWFWKKFWC